LSDDELMVMVISAAVSIVLWARWYYLCLAPRRLLSSFRERWPLWLMPLLCAAVTLAILLTVSSFDVSSSALYTTFYLVLGAAWVGAALLLAPLLGLRPFVDIAHRRNAAARPMLAGAMLGLTLAFAGGNIGDGPGWWVVFYSSGLATLAFLLAWLALDLLASATEAVTIDRSAAAGVRLGALFVANGLILGRAAAGDWQSVAATNADFAAQAWMAGVLMLVEAAASRILRPSATTPRPSVLLAGIPAALLYLAAAAVWLDVVGPW
jgi:hypothetical protein